jgi:hypothetical protein
MTNLTTDGDPALHFFVTGLPHGHDAVTARLTLRWSSGSVELAPRPSPWNSTASPRGSDVSTPR